MDILEIKSNLLVLYMKEKYFYDPKHGGCLRILTRIDDNKSIIKGAYGNDEKEKGHWFAEVTHFTEKTVGTRKYNMKVDFKNKKGLTHKPIYNAYMKNREIKWEDGNIWKELYA